jgi:hypothetical protein
MPRSNRFSTVARIGEKRETKAASSSSRNFPGCSGTMRFVGRPTKTGFPSRVFRTLRISSGKKNMVFECGRYPTEDASDEKDCSFDDCNSGATERRINLFLC